jgi:NADPH-dependent 2,4-dienoyl-CoA reductase/sulfur reductase-like enzyme
LQVVIIGNGISGISAAINLRKRKPDWRITVVSGESDYFFSRPALMYIYMGHMRFSDTKPYEDRFWEKMKIERVRAWVKGVDTSNQRVLLEGREPLPYDKLLLATGSKPNKFGWPGQDLERVQGFYSLQDVEVLERSSVGLRRAVIVGGGLIGLEMAEMLHTRGAHVTMLVREPSYWANVMPNAESAMINELIRQEGFDLRLKSELSAILDDGNGQACAVETKDGERIECQLVGLTTGVSPNLTAIRESDIPVGRGVLVDRRLGTQEPNVFAAGDCAEIVTPEGERNLIQQVWYTGKMQGEVAADNMAGDEKEYDQGIWYNSAKFIDLEWHTYGRMTCGLDEGTECRLTDLLWQDRDRRRSVRIVLEDGKLVGVNTLGIRYRHRVCEQWIAAGRDTDYILAHLGEANFDPEFFKRHEPEIVGIMKEQVR